MKTTICADTGRAHVQPLPKSGAVLLSITGGADGASIILTADQCGALIFGIEMAMEVMETRAAGAGVSPLEKTAVSWITA